MSRLVCKLQANGVGDLILQRLAERGVSAEGDSSCKNQCDLCKPVEEAMGGWWYEPNKNKWKLRKKFRNRQAQLQAGLPESEREARRAEKAYKTGGIEVRRRLERQRLGPE